MWGCTPGHYRGPAMLSSDNVCFMWSLIFSEVTWLGVDVPTPKLSAATPLTWGGCCIGLEGLGLEGSHAKLTGEFCMWCTMVFSGCLEFPPDATLRIEDPTRGWVSSVAWSSQRAFMLGIVGMNKFSFSRVFNMHIIACWKASMLSGALFKLCRSVWHRWIISSSSSRLNMIPLISSAIESNNGFLCQWILVCQFDVARDLSCASLNRRGLSSDDRSELLSMLQPSESLKSSGADGAGAEEAFREVPEGRSLWSADRSSRIGKLYSLIDGKGWAVEGRGFSVHVPNNVL